jgi:hypothetical protein
MPDETNHNKWLGIGRYILSFLAGVIVASFIVGSRSQKMADLLTWKGEIGPKVERIDSVGSLSFDHWKEAYKKDQQRTDERLKELEKDVKEIQKNNDP